MKEAINNKWNKLMSMDYYRNYEIAILYGVAILGWIL